MLCSGLLRRGSTRCTTMHWYPLQAQIQVCLFGHTIYRVTVLRPAALMQRPGCEPESLIATQRRPVAKKKDFSMLCSGQSAVIHSVSLSIAVPCRHGGGGGTTGARCGPDQGSVVENRHTTGLKVVAPGLLEKIQLREVHNNNVLRVCCCVLTCVKKERHGKQMLSTTIKMV